MARVPMVTGNSVALQPRSRERIRPVDTTGLAGGMARGISELAGGLDNLAELQTQLEAERSDREAKQALIEFNQEASDRLNNPQKGVLTLGGRDALEAYEPTIAGLRERAGEYERGLSSPRATQAFRDRVLPQLTEYESAVARHTATQRVGYDNQQSAALIATEEDAGISGWRDPDLVENHIIRARGEVATLGARPANGWSAEQLTHRQLLTESTIRSGVVERMVGENVDDAERWFRQHEGGFTADDAQRATDRIRVQRARNEAEQRRVEAEQRAQAALMRRETKERLDTLRVSLETGAGDSGDWEELATGYGQIGDTSAAAQARIKGTEMRAVERYRGSSLGEIDTRLNEIAALGGRRALTPEEAAEQNGLRTYREQTKSRLERPGGLMAQMQSATGEAMTPLTDDASFRRRAGQAMAAASRYGRSEVQPLTEAEIPGLRDLVNGGSEGRMRALDAITKFADPRAVKGAAAQVAEKSDGAFRIAATLMGLPGGRLVARDVLRGVDAEKTNAAAFQKSQAQLLFARHVGPALAATPDYAADVFDAARAFYLARMTQEGKSGWSDDAWNTAVESVLGGYRDSNGQYLGGFTRIHGVPVVLPSGWSNEGLARRIARATGPQWAAASVNGNPIWPDGSPVYSAQLREMVPVRVGETVYAFRDRSEPGLIQSGAQPGKPFTVDVARLPWQ